MEEDKEKVEGMESSDRDEIYSNAVRAGKRTYFFDVKATRRSDYYLTITESKKRYHNDGRFFYEKHKIFLYKEDFDKFLEGLDDVVQYIRENSPIEINEDQDEELIVNSTPNYTDVDFEDLEGVESSSIKSNED
jgi:hypothetical protein